MQFDIHSAKLAIRIENCKRTRVNGFPVHFWIIPKEIPPLIVYFKVLLHRFSFNGLLKAKVQTYFQTAKLFML